MPPLEGIFAAAVTPLAPDLSPDLEALPTLLDFLAQQGAHGALLLGTTGEGPSFSPAEREAILRAALQVRAAHPGFRLLAGTGTPSLTETADLTRLAFDLGYDGALVLPPYYFRQATEDGLFAYFAGLIRRAVPADSSLFIYHIPSLTGVTLTTDFLARLQQAFPGTFAGLKDSSHDAGFARELGERFGASLTVFTGTDSLLQLALGQQAAGCITAPANLFTPQLRAVWDAFRAGQDPSPAQAELSDRRHVLERYAPFPPILKGLLAHRQGFPRWPVRPPLVPVDDERLARAAAELERLD